MKEVIMQKMNSEQALQVIKQAIESINTSWENHTILQNAIQTIKLELDRLNEELSKKKS